MRIVSSLLILAGLLLLGDAAYDEFRGIAETMPPGRASQLEIVARADDPDAFRNLMAYQWLRGPLALVAGLAILGFCRRADRLDALASEGPP